MAGCSFRRAIVVLLAAGLFIPSLGAKAHGYVSSDTSEAECNRRSEACVFGSVFAALVAPYTYAFSDFRASYQQGPEQPVLGVRVERRFRSVGAADERMHPYVGIGMQIGYTVHGADFSTMGRVSTEVDFETTLGYQWGLDSSRNTLLPWMPSVLVGAELQWLPFRESDSVRVEMAPGFSLPLSRGRQINLHLSASVAPFGQHRGDIRPGVSIVVN